MNKKYAILAIIFLIAIRIFGENHLSGFPHYVKLSETQKKAFDDYKENYESIGPFMLICDKTDSTSFTIVGYAFDMSGFLSSPSYYYSFYKGQFVAIYDGTENDYYPTADDFALMFDFLSHFISVDVVIVCADGKYKLKTITPEEPLFKTRPPLYDPPFVRYYTDGDSIIKKKEVDGDIYPKLRFYNLRKLKYPV